MRTLSPPPTHGPSLMPYRGQPHSHPLSPDTFKSHLGSFESFHLVFNFIFEFPPLFHLSRSVFVSPSSLRADMSLRVLIGPVGPSRFLITGSMANVLNIMKTDRFRLETSLDLGQRQTVSPVQFLGSVHGILSSHPEYSRTFLEIYPMPSWIYIQAPGI